MFDFYVFDVCVQCVLQVVDQCQCVGIGFCGGCENYFVLVEQGCFCCGYFVLFGICDWMFWYQVLWYFVECDMCGMYDIVFGVVNVG